MALGELRKGFCHSHNLFSPPRRCFIEGEYHISFLCRCHRCTPRSQIVYHFPTQTLCFRCITPELVTCGALALFECHTKTVVKACPVGQGWNLDRLAGQWTCCSDWLWVWWSCRTAGLGSLGGSNFSGVPKLISIGCLIKDNGIICWHCRRQKLQSSSMMGGRFPCLTKDSCSCRLRCPR